MGVLPALIHGQAPAMLVRHIGEVWVLQGVISITVWMPLTSKLERAGGPGGSIPGWRSAMALLVSMGVDLESGPDEIDCTFGDGLHGTAFLWPMTGGVEQLPGGHPALTSWDHDPAHGSVFRVTGLEPDVTPTTLLWHVGFNTTAAVVELDRQMAEVTA